MTVAEFNAKFNKFEDEIPNAKTMAGIMQVIEQSGFIIVDQAPPMDLTDEGDGLFEIGVNSIDNPAEIPYAFGIGVTCGTIDDLCGLEVEEF